MSTRANRGPVPLAVDNTAGKLPATADCVVIGGGIVGASAARELVRRGLRVVLLEKGIVAGEQSGRNWGWIRKQGRDLAELPMMADAIRVWQDLPTRLRDAVGFRQSGITYLARDAARVAAFEAWLAGARPLGVDSVLLSRRQTEAMLPNAAGWVGALHTPSDGQAEPFVAVPVLAHAAAQDGAILREGCAVRRLTLSAGRVTGIITELGHVRCDRVVLAAGAWSSLFLAAHGIRLPQLSVASTAMATPALPELLSGAAADDRFAIRRRTDGGYTLAPWSLHEFFIGPNAFRHLRAFLPQFMADPGSTRLRLAAPARYPDAWRTRRRWDGQSATPFEACRILDPRPHPGAIARSRQQFAAAFPQTGLPPIDLAWAGMIDVTPDSLPVVDQSPLPGLVLATGMSGHGFGIAPAVALLVADLTMGRRPRHDLAPFRLDRFRPGNRLRCSSAI